MAPHPFIASFAHGSHEDNQNFARCKTWVASADELAARFQDVTRKTKMQKRRKLVPLNQSYPSNGLPKVKPGRDVPIPIDQASGVDFNTDKTVHVPRVLNGAVRFRARRAYHPRVGYSIDQYAAFQEHKFKLWPVGFKSQHGLQAAYQQHQLEPPGSEPGSPIDAQKLWPYTGSKTLGLFTLRGGSSWDGKTSNAGNQLITLLRNKDVANLILSMLFTSGHFNVANLGATCQSMFDMVADFSDQWDVCFGEFNNCHLVSQERDQLAKEEAAKIGVGNFLRVVNSRAYCQDFAEIQPARHARASNRTDSIAWAKFRDNCVEEEYFKRTERKHSSSVDCPNPPPFAIWKLSYLDKITNIHSLSTAIFQFGANLNVLQLHRVPLLDYRMVTILLAGCPNLESLGIYKCEMIHYGHILTLLDIAHDFNTKLDRIGKARLQLDVYPRYHRGPDCGRHATFGLTWQNCHFIPVQQGVFQILLAAILKAEAMGIDILSRHTAFRKYLEDIPLHLWSIPDFIDAVFTYLHWHRKPISVDQQRTLLHDILAVVVRGLEGRGVRLAHELRHLWSSPCYCSSCGLIMPRIFFEQQEAFRRATERVCAGCNLRAVLDNEKDHYKSFKKSLIDEVTGATSDNCSASTTSPPQRVPDSSVEAPLLSNDLFVRGTAEATARLLPGDFVYERISVTFDRPDSSLPPLHTMAGPAADYFRWAAGFRFALHMDIRDRYDQDVFQSKDDWATPQPATEGGPCNQLSWETLRRKKDFDRNGHPPGDDWYLV